MLSVLPQHAKRQYRASAAAEENMTSREIAFKCARLFEVYG